MPPTPLAPPPEHYLESLDPVRSAWGTPTADDAVLLAQLDTLIGLAFGRDLVIQQSSAIDSYASQVIVRDVGQAFAAASTRDARARAYWATRPRPIRLHLYHAPTFADAVADTVARIEPFAPRTDPAAPPPFRSSLYPELHSADCVDRLGKAVTQLREDGRADRFERLLPDSRRVELFRAAWRWFETARAGDVDTVVLAEPRERPADLDATVRWLADPGNRRADPRSSKRPEVVRAVLEAIRELEAAAGGAPAPFRDRSRLHGAWPWFGSDRTPEELVGVERLTLLREVVDTLYNRVVVSSIGRASASYTTALSTIATASAEAAAQDFALRAADEGVVTSGAERALDVATKQVDPARAPYSAAEMAEVYERLLSARVDPSWDARLGRIRTSRPGRAREDLLAEHCEQVARCLAGLGTISERGGRVRFAISATGVAGTAVSTSLTDVLADVDPTTIVTTSLAASGVGAVAAAVPAVFSIWRRRRRLTEARNAFGQLVEPPRR